MGVSSLPETVTRQRHGCSLNPGPSAPESSALTTRLPSHPSERTPYVELNGLGLSMAERIQAFCEIYMAGIILLRTVSKREYRVSPEPSCWLSVR